jgi:arylsulfatase A-like enzyme
VCLTDLLATCASILGDELPADAGEDSYDILPALLGEPYAEPIREATVHHAGDGSFSIRQGRWKLELTPSSGGYGNLDDAEVRQRNLPPIQLYDLDADIAETRNLYDRYPELVERLTALLESYQERGRSTPG